MKFWKKSSFRLFPSFNFIYFVVFYMLYFVSSLLFWTEFRTYFEFLVFSVNYPCFSIALPGCLKHNFALLVMEFTIFKTQPLRFPLVCRVRYVLLPDFSDVQALTPLIACLFTADSTTCLGEPLLKMQTFMIMFYQHFILNI